MRPWNRRLIRAGRLGAALVAAVAGLHGAPAKAERQLFGPMRIRDTSPFSFLRLDMMPSQALAPGRGSYWIEAELTYSNTFVMSDNVQAYLESVSHKRGPLSQADADAILALGEDAYYVDGESSLLDVTLTYGVSEGASVYLSVPVYSFTGGFLDGTIEAFHDTFGLGNERRELVARNRFQTLMSLQGEQRALLDPPDGGLGDPVLGGRYSVPLRGSDWSLVLDGAVKTAVGGERLFLSSGGHDLGAQIALWRSSARHGIYLGTSVVRTDGRILGAGVGSRTIPTLTSAYALGITPRLNVIVQAYASRSPIQDTTLEALRADKVKMSLGLQGVGGRLIYGVALTENVFNFENTPDIGLSFNLGWTSSRRH